MIKVSEDRNLIQHIKTNFLDNPNAVISKIPNYVSNNPRNDKDFMCANPVKDILEADFSPLIECENVQVSSPKSSSNGFESNQPGEESFMIEAINGEASQVQSWQFMDDEISNCIHNSMNSSDCISQTYANPKRMVPPLYDEKVNNNFLHDLHECNQKKLDSFDFKSDDVHYQNVLSTLLKSSHQLILGPHCRKNNMESSFVNWKKERSVVFQKPRCATSQRVLKKVLFEVTKMHGDLIPESSKENGKKESIWRPEADEIDRNHVMAERKRREKLHERFTLLGSLVPSSGKVISPLLQNSIEAICICRSLMNELFPNVG